MREGKRQIGGADGRSNAVGRRRNTPGTKTRCAGLSGRWRAAVSHRPLAAPAPLLSIIALARALFPTTSAFSLCSLPRSPQFYNSSPARPNTCTNRNASTPVGKKHSVLQCAPSLFHFPERQNPGCGSYLEWVWGSASGKLLGRDGKFATFPQHIPRIPSLSSTKRTSISCRECPHACDRAI